MTIRDLNRILNWELPDDKASTIAGLILMETRIIPSENQEFRFHGIRFTVLEREGTRLTKFRLAVDSGQHKSGEILQKESSS